MKKIIFNLLFLIVSFASFSQSNDDYVYVGSSLKNTKVYILFEKTDSNGIKEFWLKMTNPLKSIKNKKGKIIKTGGGYSVEYVRMNCEGKIYSVSDAVNYDRFNNATSIPDYYQRDDERIIPGTIMSAVYNYICN